MRKSAFVITTLFLLLAVPVFAADQLKPKSTASSEWLTLKGTAAKIPGGYILLDWDAKAGIEFSDKDTKLESGTLKVRSGAVARRLFNQNGVVIPTAKVKIASRSLAATPDRRTMCIGLAQTCCANGRVIHACIGAAGCDFGDDSACD